MKRKLTTCCRVSETSNWQLGTHLNQWPDLPITHDGSREEFNVLALDCLLAVAFHDAHRTQEQDELNSVEVTHKFVSVRSIAEISPYPDRCHHDLVASDTLRQSRYADASGS